MVLSGILGPKRDREEDGAVGNIWTQEGGSEWRMVPRGIFCTQERGSERRRVPRGILWIQERGSERRMVLRGIFGSKREEVREGWC